MGRRTTFGEDIRLHEAQLQEAYETGLMGATCDPTDTAALLEELPMPSFGDAAPHLMGTGDGKVVVLFPSYQKFDPGAFTEAQTTGSCVSHATRNALDLVRAIEIDIKGEPEKFKGRGCTEPIYGSRGTRGQGMSCSGAIRFVTQSGGLITRGVYGRYDLSKLDDSLAASWGGPGTPADVVAECKKHQARTASQVKTPEEAMAALANGYALVTCGGDSWSNVRDEHGISETTRQGWAHGLCVGGFDDSRQFADETLWLVHNSWANWNRGGNPPWGKLPMGSWLSRNKPMVARFRQGGTFAVGTFEGWPAQRLPPINILG